MYNRRFTLQVSHFNDETYALLPQARNSDDADEARRLYEKILFGTHGHNLTVETSFGEVFVDDGKPWVVDDAALVSVLQGFDNCNLSVHPAFRGRRATTENIVRVIAERLEAAGVKRPFSISVQENDSVEATEEFS